MSRTPSRPPSAPFRQTFLTYWLGRFLMWWFDWRVQGDCPDIPQAVIVAGPHSSYLDAVIGFSAFHSMQLKVTILVKKSAFLPGIGGFLRYLGGVPVDRSGPGGLIAAAVSEFDENPRLALLLTPEGTRQGATRIRTGFHHIARQAGVPVLPLILHHGRRRVEIGPLMWPSDNIQADIDALCRLFIQRGEPRFPERMSAPLRRLVSQSEHGDRND